MFLDMSPSLQPSHFASGPEPPPSPPSSTHQGPLDDIYGSAPNSPNLNATNADLQPSEFGASHAPPRADEILSDLPYRQRMIDTDAYREGLSASKGKYVQEGFDEGYSLGANMGQRVGYILGFFQGCETALRGHDKMMWQEAKGLLDAAQAELAIQEVLGKSWVDEEGVWKWEVHGEEEEVTFREVADQHPVLRSWMKKVEDVAEKWNIDLTALEKSEEEEMEETAL